MKFTAQEVFEAYDRIKPYLPDTPLAESVHLGDGERRYFFKLENLQPVKSFKVRGALNKMLTLTDEEKQKQEQAYWDKFKEALETGKAMHHKILIREGANTYTGIIIGVTARCVYVDLKDEYGRLLQHNARMPRNSPRFIIESFR